MRSHLLLALAVSCLHAHFGADGLCFTRTATDYISRFGKVVKYCEFRGLKLLPGSQIKTDDCLKCNCTSMNFRCCGNNFNYPTFEIPNNCKMLYDSCEFYLVKTTNENLDCITGLPFMLDTQP